MKTSDIELSNKSLLHILHIYYLKVQYLTEGGQELLGMKGKKCSNYVGKQFVLENCSLGLRKNLKTPKLLLFLYNSIM